jgi:hypothetical protein
MATNTATATWEIWTYDVWGNAQDGWEVNDRFCQQRAAEMPTDADDATILRTLKEWGILKKTTQLRHLEIDGDDGLITVNQAKDGYPLCEMILNDEPS